MKLRFRENSLRLRVNRPEVENLAAGGGLIEKIEFPGDARLTYILESSPQTSADASFADGVIRVSLPDWQVRDWACGDAIGMYFQVGPEGRHLKVAVEKDLECVDGPPDERDPEAFPRAPGKNC